MTVDEMKDLVRRHHEDVINRKDWSVLPLDLAPHFVDHGPVEADAADAAHGWLAELQQAFPDLHATIDDLVAEDDRVVARKTWTGTHAGAFRGLEPTGRRVVFGGVVIWRIEQGRLAERWVTLDLLGLVAQLGRPAMA